MKRLASSGKVRSDTKAVGRQPVTPDGRYFLVGQTLWRCTNPQLPESTRKRLVKELMSARRAVGEALKKQDDPSLRRARSRVDLAKRALGERGPVWWTDGAPDYNRRRVDRTPYAAWARKQEAA